MLDLSLFRAIPELRGCGEREPEGVYVESGVGPFGFPLEHFLLDPPQPVPEGLDLINKPRIWPRTLPSGEPVLGEAGQPIYDLLIHVGVAYYPWAPDYIEETRRLGASRRLSANLALGLLTRESQMLLAHPKAIPLNWQEMRPPERCKKRLAGHDMTSPIPHAQDALSASERGGPCLFKLWDLIPREQAESAVERSGERPLCLRRIGTTVYQFVPTEELVSGWVDAFVLCLPLTGFALIQDVEGLVNAQAKAKLLEAQERHGPAYSLPFYETPR